MPSRNVAEPNPAIIPKLKKVLDLLVEKDGLQSEIKAYRDCAKLSASGLRRHNFGKSFARACKECLCAHRFEAAGQLLEMLCSEHSAIDHFVFMAGLQVLENHPSASETEVLQFIRRAQFLKFINKKEVCIELINYLLRNNISHISSGGELVHTMASRVRKSTLRKNILIDPLMKAYVALFDYTEWMDRCKKGENHTDIAQTTVTSFKQVLELPGQNDIFVLKLVEILEYYERYDEAEDCLVKYVEMNPEHINAYMYICSFLHKHNRDSMKLMEYLKKLAKLNPYDPFVLILVKELKEKDHANEKSLKLLFSFLDCPAHTQNLKAWKNLSKLVFHVLQYPVPTESNVMNACWDEIRSSFWNSVHFCSRKIQLTSASSAKVAMHKAVILSVLEDCSHPYVQDVLEKLPAVSEKVFSKLIKKLAAIDDLKNNINEQSYEEEEGGGEAEEEEQQQMDCS